MGSRSTRGALLSALVVAAFSPAARAQRFVAEAAGAPLSTAVQPVGIGVWDTLGSYWELRTWSQGWSKTGSIDPLPSLSPNRPEAELPAGREIRPASRGPAPTIAPARAAEGVPSLPAESALRDSLARQASSVPEPEFRLRAIELPAPENRSAFLGLAAWMRGEGEGLSGLSLRPPQGRQEGLKDLLARLSEISLLRRPGPLSDDGANTLAGRDFDSRSGADAQSPGRKTSPFRPVFPGEDAAAGSTARAASPAAASSESPSLSHPRPVAAVERLLGARLAPLKAAPALPEPASAGAGTAVPLSRFYVSLKAPSVEDPAAFLEESLDGLGREAGFRLERTLGYRPAAGGPILIVLGELPADRLDGLRRVPQVAGVEPAPAAGVNEDFRDAPHSVDSNPLRTWLGSGLPSLYSALLLAFPLAASLLRRLAGPF